MRKPYPLIEPNRAEWVEVGGGHRIYFEEAGPENGLPVVFLHGGPGSGCKPSHRQFFDPKRYRSVLVDQRGSGKSTPLGGVENNTTQDLVGDLERIRVELDIPAWVLFGGSWGAALALAYAQSHPDRVLAMVLRGTFLARSYDVDWFFEHGASRLMPREWATFEEKITPKLLNGESMLECLHRCTFGGDDAVRDEVATAWAQWSEAVVLYAFNNLPSGGEPDPSAVVRAKTRIEMHYAKHGYFISDNQLLEQIGQLPDVPVKIIHGHRDITCTPDAGWALHQAIPKSEFTLLRTAGHLSGEAPMTEALLRAADEIAALIDGCS